MRIIAVFFFCLGMHGVSPGQGSSHPTPPVGTNSVAYDPTSNGYLFRFRDRVLYRYEAADHPSMTRSGATLHAITAVPENGEIFRPSNAGGIVAEFGTTTANPWTAGVSFVRLQTPSIVNDTVVSRWRMLHADGGSIDYHLRLSIRGRTLTIVIGTDGGDGVATGFTLDRCEGAAGARVVRVPYLPLFNLLFSGSGSSDGIYTSLFFDWESTNASSLTPFRPRDYQRSSTSVSFSQNALYLKKTDGTRNRLSEVVYLTLSPDLSEVLPNLAGPPAPLKNSIAVKTVISYNPPFTWLLRPFDPPTYNFIDSIHAIGLRDVALIIKNWQKGQFDHKYPSVLPPNSFDVDVCTGRPYGAGGGMEGILSLKQKIDAFGYELALHENYVDYYVDAGPGEFEFHPADVALMSDGSTVDGWLNCSKETSKALKPSRVEAYAEYWSTRINEQIDPAWSYLDVHTALDPTKAVDLDATVDGAGKYGYTIQQYRKVASVLRAAYGGPVQGEGHYQILYAGYFDDFEGRLHTADPTLFGVKAPLFVDFDLLKIRPKSAQHGVGHIHSFLDVGRLDTLDVSLFQYVATELAYGHGGLISKNLVRDHTLRQAQLENTHVFPIQKAIAGAMPVENGGILYSDGGPTFQTASEYIARHPQFDNIKSDDFMGRVKVTYDNGVVICVNRSSRPWKVSDIGAQGGWYTFNTTTALDTGFVQTRTFELRAYGGWVGFRPL